MSWDLYLVPAEHAEDVGDWLESMADAAGNASAAAEHAEAIRARHPELELWGPDESGVIELSSPEDSEFPLQVYLDGHHAAVSVAYWDLGERTPELADLVVDVVTALTERTGWVAFDQQEDRVVGLDEVRAVFLGGHEHGVGLVRELVAEEGAAQAPKRRRFFGLFGG